MSVFAKNVMLACALVTVYSPRAEGQSNCNNCKTCHQCSPANCNGCCVNCKGNSGKCDCCECTTTASHTTTSLVTTTASSTATASVTTSASDTTTSSGTMIQSSPTTLLFKATTTSNLVYSSVSLTTEHNNNSIAASGHVSTSSSNFGAGAQVAGSHDYQVVAVVVSVVLAVVVVAGAVVLVVWWKRKRASKSGGTGNAHTSWRMSDTDVPSQTNQDSEVATRGKERQNSAAGGSQNRISEHVYTHIDSVTNLRPKSTIEGRESSVYNEPDDVGDRKLPTAPAQDTPYSLARNPSTEHGAGPQQSAPLAGVFSLAHTTNQNIEKPKYFSLEEERKVSSQNKADVGQYFMLEEGAATNESDNKLVTRGQNDASVHDAHEYSPLDASDRAQNFAEGDAEYTPLHGKTGVHPKITAKMHGDHEYSDLDPGMKMKPVSRGAEYTALEHNFNALTHAATGTVNSTGDCMHKGVKGKQI